MDRKTVKQINQKNKKVNILVDASNLFYRSIFSLQRQLVSNGYSDFGLFKHKVFSIIIDFSTYFPDKNVVLCFDNKKDEKYWRNDIYKEYKGNRKDAIHSIPKDIMYNQFDEIYNETKEFLPWCCVKVDSVEADDIIAVYVKNHKDDINIVYSPDKDFIQLLSEDVYLYDPMKHIFVEEKNPKRYLFEHIVRGDTGDGISNVYSDINTTMIPGKTQKTIRKTKIAEMWEAVQEGGMIAVKKFYLSPGSKGSINEQHRFIENTKLIDLSRIPQDIEDRIMKSVNDYKIKGNRKSFWDYCIKNGLNKLSEKSMLL